jgi:hypothetical protein
MTETFMTAIGPVDAYAMSVICRFMVGPAVDGRGISPPRRPDASCAEWLLARALEAVVLRLVWRLAVQAVARCLLWLNSFWAGLMRVRVAPRPPGTAPEVSAGNLRAHRSNGPPARRAARSGVLVSPP